MGQEEPQQQSQPEQRHTQAQPGQAGGACRGRPHRLAKEAIAEHAKADHNAQGDIEFEGLWGQQQREGGGHGQGGFTPSLDDIAGHAVDHRDDDGGDGGDKAGKEAAQGRQLTGVREIEGSEGHDEEHGGEQDGNGRDEGAGPTAQSVSDIGDTVDALGSGQEVGEGDAVEHIVIGEEFVFFDNGIGDDGDEGHEAAKGDAADFEKNPEQLTERDRVYCDRFSRARNGRVKGRLYRCTANHRTHVLFPLAWFCLYLQ